MRRKKNLGHCIIEVRARVRVRARVSGYE